MLVTGNHNSTTGTLLIVFISSKLVPRKTATGKGLFARQAILRGEKLISFSGRVVSKPSPTTLQINEGKHLEGPGEMDDYLNHSCEPNCFIDFESLDLRALRDIEKDEQLTFNYLTTEWNMARKFECVCGAEACLHSIKGFKYLTLSQREVIEKFLSPFLRSKNLEELPS